MTNIKHQEKSKLRPGKLCFHCSSGWEELKSEKCPSSQKRRDQMFSKLLFPQYIFFSIDSAQEKINYQTWGAKCKVKC